MNENTKYLMWNNKGGVGKTFLTYMLSVEYAINHPNEDVVVIDACPQSNVSEMILGGNGKGEANLERGAVRPDQYNWASPIRVRVGAAVAEHGGYPGFTTTQVTTQNQPTCQTALRGECHA